MSNLPLRDLVWKDAVISSEAQHEFFNYRVIPDHDSVDKFAVRYKDSGHRPATGFATIEDAKEWAWGNYNEKMQPYVVPPPTWIDAGKNLPEDKEKYLVLTECGKVWTGHYGLVAAKPNEWWLHGYTVKQGWHPYTVTHWMPIPEFSKQGE